MVVRRKDNNKCEDSQIREDVLEQLKQCIISIQKSQEVLP